MYGTLSDTVTGLFADMPIRAHDNLRTCQFVDKTFRRHASSRTVDGQFAERRFADKGDYSRTICLKSPINRTFVIIDTRILLKLYISLVRPKLDYCIPYFIKDIDLLEKMQKRATHLMITEKGLIYEESPK